MTKFGDPKIVKNKIMEYLQIDEDEYNDFINKSLKKYNAVIAGGFVLSCFSDFTSNDIDIYITSKNMKKFASNLPAYLSPYKLDFISKYDSIGKKYVQRMLCFKYDENDVPNYDIKVDIVIVEDNYTIDEVIDNFDLTFCKIWFDGDNVYASYPSDIKNKKGSLNKKYINDYYLAIKKTMTDIDLLHARNRKYTSRGFTIKVAKDPHPSQIVVSREEKGIPILLSDKQTGENIAIKIILQNFTNNNIVKYLMNDIQYYSKYISKYLSLFYYTEEYNERYYIEKITLFKFYFIALFKEFTFEEYVKNFHKLFSNIRIEYIYKTALYSLEEYLDYMYDIKTEHDFTDTRLIQFKNKNRSKEFDPKAYTIMRFMIDNLLNKYENYKFTNLIDYKYLLTEERKYGNEHQFVLKDRISDIHKIDSSEFNKILQTKKKCVKFITKADVKKLLQNSKLTGFDFINCDQDVNIAKYLNQNKENIIIVVLSPDNTPSITCISKKDLDNMISDINDNWFYDCERMKNHNICPTDTPETVIYKENKYLYKPFIKVPLSNGTFYFEYNYIYSLFMSKQQVFFAYQTPQEIKKTASYKNTNDGIRKGLANYVSANHCQDGSNIRLYQIKTLKLDDKKTLKRTATTVRSSSKSSKSSSSSSPKSKSK